MGLEVWRSLTERAVAWADNVKISLGGRERSRGVAEDVGPLCRSWSASARLVARCALVFVWGAVPHITSSRFLGHRGGGPAASGRLPGWRPTPRSRRWAATSRSASSALATRVCGASPGHAGGAHDGHRARPDCRPDGAAHCRHRRSMGGRPSDGHARGAASG